MVLADRSIHDIDFQLDLIDVNDNPPRFNQSIYRINILETTPINNIVSTEISAYDLDSGLFGQFTYSLPSSTSAYQVRFPCELAASIAFHPFVAVLLSINQSNQCQSSARQTSRLQLDGSQFQSDHRRSGYEQCLSIVELHRLHSHHRRR